MQILPADHPLQSSLLDDTAIGPLRVVEWQGDFFVAKVFSCDRERVKEIIHTLQPGQNPLDAVYGKRVMEQKTVRKLYDAISDVADRTAASAKRDMSKDFIKGAWKLWNKGDGPDAFMSLMRERERARRREEN